MSEKPEIYAEDLADSVPLPSGYGMPERILAGVFDNEGIEYIRADVAQSQLDAANRRIAELEAALQWVNVDERLPEVGASVATKSRTGVYGVIMDVRNSGEWFYAVFSHWMPLPPPPTQGTSA